MRGVCSPDPAVLTLISVPWNVRGGSVSVRVFGIDLRRRIGFPGGMGWRSSAGRASDL